MNDPSPLPREIKGLAALLEGNASEYHEANDDEIVVKVSNNLRDRHTQLYWLEHLTRQHRVHESLKKEQKAKENQSPPPRSGISSYCTSLFQRSSKKHDPPEKLLPEERVYHLAVTDLFVEKAQAFLEQRADLYQSSGRRARRIASAIVLLGAILAWNQMVTHYSDHAKTWLELSSSFVRSFTAYGMIVLASVGFWNYSKAMLDQAERLYARRHALRQGRLFVHLNDGKLTIDEMEKAFSWNESQANAFANINTEASAPWGAFAKELAKSFPDIFKAGIQAISKGKADDK